MNATRSLLAIVCVVGVILIAGPAKADFAFGKLVSSPFITSSGGFDCFSSDGLEMYVDSNRSGGSGDWDLYVVKRASQDQDWGPPENLGPTVNSPNEDSFSSISADGLTLYFNSNRPGGSGSYDMYTTTRATKNDPWGPAVNLGPTLNSPAADVEAWISADGLELYFSSFRPGGLGSSDIYVAKRGTTNDSWGAPVNLGSIVNSAYGEQSLSLSPDGLLLLFSDLVTASSFRPGGYGGADMWMARRASLSDPWQAPVNLGPTVNGPAGDIAPRISPDGSTFYLSQGVNTSQAPIIPIVDFNGDDKVDGKEVLTMAEHWGQNYSLCDIGPFAWGDGVVDVQDLKVLAEYIGKDIEDPTFIAHWAFDETEGNTAQDSAGANDATVMGTALWQPEGGKVGGALQLSGAPNFIATKLARDPASGPLSVFAWVKGGTPGQVILSQAGGANWLMASSPDGALMTNLRSAARQATSLTTTDVITDGNWHRVGLSWDGANRILYVDDVEAARDAQTSLAGSTKNLSIGAGSTMAPASFWTGLIDDVRIYDRAVKP